MISRANHRASGRARRTRAGGVKHVRLRVEPLEARRLLAVIAWGGAATGNWSTGGNWVGGVAPDADDTAVFSTVSQVTLTQGVEVARLLVTAGNLTLNLANFTLVANSEDAPSVVVAESPGQVATLTLTGSPSGQRGAFEAEAVIIGLQGTGTLNFTGRARLRSETGQLGVSFGSSGTANVGAHTQSEWRVNDALIVGRSGEGHLDVSTGALVDAGSLVFGATGGAIGSARVHGTDSVLTAVKKSFNLNNTGWLSIGGVDVQPRANLGLSLGPGGAGSFVAAYDGGSVSAENSIHVWEGGELNASGAGFGAPGQVSVGESVLLPADFAPYVDLSDNGQLDFSPTTNRVTSIDIASAVRDSVLDPISETGITPVSGGQFALGDIELKFVQGRFEIESTLIEILMPGQGGVLFGSLPDDVGGLELSTLETGTIAVVGNQVELRIPYRASGFFDPFGDGLVTGILIGEGVLVARAQLPAGGLTSFFQELTFFVDSDQSTFTFSGTAAIGSTVKPFVSQPNGSLSTGLQGFVIAQVATNAIFFPGGSRVGLIQQPGPFLPGVPSLPGIVQVLSGGTLTGQGVVQGNVSNNGIVRPGDAGTGLLMITGAYTQTNFGALQLDVVAGTPDTQLSVGGLATIDGDLLLTRVGDAAPAPGDSGAVAFYGGRTGEFAQVRSTGFPSGIAPEVSFLADRLLVGINGFQSASVGGQVTFDADRDGQISAGDFDLNNVIVQLKADRNNDGQLELIAEQAVDSGFYRFENVEPGAYVIDILDSSLPVNYSTTDQEPLPILVLPDDFLTYNFGYRNLTTLNLVLFNDLDNDGQQDPGESFSGAQLSAFLAAVHLERDADLNGTYETPITFDGFFVGDRFLVPRLVPGQYRITVDPFADLTSPTELFVDLIQDTDTHARFGLQSGPPIVGGGDIFGTVFRDINGNSEFDAQEPALVGVTVVLIKDGVTEIAQQTTTVGGQYHFDVAESGSYRVDVLPASVGGYLDMTTVALKRAVSVADSTHTVNVGVSIAANNTVQGVVFRDLDADGNHDLGEPALPDTPGVPVTLRQDTDGDGTYETLLQQTLTSAGGGFGFSVPAGRYQVDIDTDAIDNVLARRPAAAATFNLSSGFSINFADFGLELAPQGTIRGRVFNDLDLDGDFDALDTNLEDVEVQLYRVVPGNAPQLVDFQLTDLLGEVFFDELAPGDYRLVVASASLPAGTTIGPPRDVSLALDGSQVANLNVLLPPAATARIAGQVFGDIDGDSNADPGEPGQAGIVLNLRQDADNNGIYETLVTTATSGVDGAYEFNRLPPGKYRVEFDVAANAGRGTLITPPQSIDLAEGAAIDRDFFIGISGQNSISGVMFRDLDGDGGRDPGEPGPFPLRSPAARRVLLHQDMDRDGVFETLIQEINVGSAGEFSFTNLGEGRFLVSASPFDRTNPLEQTTPPLLFDLGLDTSFSDVELGISFAPQGGISGVVFEDVDGDGILDPNEMNHLAGVTVELRRVEPRGGETPLESFVTVGGSYLFDELDPGVYRVVVMPGGLPANATIGGPLELTLALDEFRSGSNIGVQFAPPPPLTTGRIAGRVFADLNADNKQQPGDAGLPGIVVSLAWDRDGDNVFETQLGRQTTDALGNYEFIRLPAGHYQVRLGESVARSGLAASALDAAVAQLMQGGAASADFGLYAPRTITGTWIEDADGDGRYDRTEKALAGRSIYLDLNRSGQFESGVDLSATTDAHGQFAFTGLRPGDYALRGVARTQELATGAGYVQSLDMTAAISREVLISGITRTPIIFKPDPVKPTIPPRDDLGPNGQGPIAPLGDGDDGGLAGIAPLSPLAQRTLGLFFLQDPIQRLQGGSDGDNAGGSLASSAKPRRFLDPLVDEAILGFTGSSLPPPEEEPVLQLLAVTFLEQDVPTLIAYDEGDFIEEEDAEPEDDDVPHGVAALGEPLRGVDGGAPQKITVQKPIAAAQGMEPAGEADDPPPADVAIGTSASPLAVGVLVAGSAVGAATIAAGTWYGRAGLLRAGRRLAARFTQFLG